MIAACIAVLGLLALTAYLLWAQGRERQEWAQERRLLNACIQRPQTAVTAATADLAEADVDMQPYVQFDDDDAFHEAMKG